MTTENTGAVPNPYTPQQMGAMRMAARNLTLTAGPDGCTIVGRTAADVRRLTGIVGHGVPQPNVAGNFRATLPAAAAKRLPFLSWNTAGAQSGAASFRSNVVLLGASREEVARMVGRMAVRFGVTRTEDIVLRKDGKWVFFVPKAWAAKGAANVASGPGGNTAGEIACAEGSHPILTDFFPFFACEFDDPPPPVTVQCGAGEVQIQSGTFAGQCVLPGSPCTRDDGPGFWTTDGLCAAAGTTTAPPTPGGGGGTTIVVSPPTPTTLATPVEEESDLKWWIGGAVLAVAAVGGGVYLAKRRKGRKSNPYHGRKGRKNRKK